jgi:hypothetical protein
VSKPPTNPAALPVIALVNTRERADAPAHDAAASGAAGASQWLQIDCADTDNRSASVADIDDVRQAILREA